VYLEFYKKTEDHIVMTIVRDDGSKTWSRLRSGFEDHDLAHYAVEKVLGMDQAFFGMINQGVEIADFEDKEKQPDISAEAIQAEHLVNLLQTEYWNNHELIDILKELSLIFIQKKLPQIDRLNESRLDEIRAVYKSAIISLRKLEKGGALKFEIELPTLTH